MSETLTQIAKYFKDDPVGYCNIVLGVKLTPDQEHILQLLTVPPFKCLVKAAHLVGKSFLAACALLWWYDTHNPSIVLTTAPTERQVNIIWKEVRTLREPWGGFVGPKAKELGDSPKHFARGMTARDGTSFQGEHEANVLIIFDEAVGVEPIFWEAAETMLNGDCFAFLGIFNPTDQSSYAYIAERTGNYHVVTLSAFNHPNIEAELRGDPAPYPSAIRLARLDELVRQWCTPLIEPPKLSDIEWPPRSGKWWRPGPVAESRLTGRWPSLAENSVWSESVWELAASRDLPDTGPVQISADPARYGSDDTAIHVRKGGVSLHHETHNGWSTSQTAARLRELAHEFASIYKLDPKRIPIVIDDIGVGGGVTDQAQGYNFIGVNVASKPINPELYNSKRSEIWFALADEAAKGNVSFAKLPQQVKDDLRRELLAPTYTLDYMGRRVVEPKDKTKDRLGRSPDSADAVLLAYTNVNMIDRVAGKIWVP